eukprot:5337164-Pyramimonas_sp.AAC.1
MVGDCPPRSSSARNIRAWRTTCRQLRAWIKEEFDTAPGRITPIVFAEMNMRMGRKGREIIVDSNLGPFQAAHEDEVATVVRKAYSDSHMSFLNSFFDLGHTYDDLKGARSPIDYFLGPRALLDTGIQMHMFWRSQRRIQALPHMIDHVPMCLCMSLPAPPPQQQQQNIQWDWGALAAALQMGRRREELMSRMGQ